MRRPAQKRRQPIQVSKEPKQISVQKTTYLDQRPRQLLVPHKICRKQEIRRRQRRKRPDQRRKDQDERHVGPQGADEEDHGQEAHPEKEPPCARDVSHSPLPSSEWEQN